MAPQGGSRPAARASDLELPAIGGGSFRLRLFPPAPDLEQDVRAAWDEVTVTASSAEDGPPALQHRLRDWYPRLVVRTRGDTASFDDATDELWYVFRDGAVRRRAEVVDRMYAALHEARQTSANSTTAMGRAASILEHAVASEPKRASRTKPPTR